MSILRIAKRRQYTNIDSRALNDAALSFRARGVLAWLLSKPDGWSVSSEAIARSGAEGRDAIRTALDELEALGYLVRWKAQDDKGRWHSEAIVYECPLDSHSLSAENQPRTENQASVNRDLGNRLTENQALIPTTEQSLLTSSEEEVAFTPEGADAFVDAVAMAAAERVFQKRKATIGTDDLVSVMAWKHATARQWFENHQGDIAEAYELGDTPEQTLDRMLAPRPSVTCGDENCINGWHVDEEGNPMKRCLAVSA